MLLLGLDFETTWTEPVDPTRARITEIGAVLFDWDLGKPIQLLSTYVWDEDYPKSPDKLVKLTGITDDMLKSMGKSSMTALIELNALIKKADYVVAHNGSIFDKIIYENESSKYGNTVSKPWIDTRIDVDYPEEISTRKLTHLAAEHGFVNPFAHRALFDALTMLKLLDHYPIDKVIANSKFPLIHSIAKVSYQDRDLAKARGYYWDGENKTWFKPMKENRFEQEEKDAPFVCAKIYPGGYK